MTAQIVKPIKDSNILEEVENSLRNDFETGERNYAIFQTGKATLLRVSDVLALKKSDVFDEDGRVKKNATLGTLKQRKGMFCICVQLNMILKTIINTSSNTKRITRKLKSLRVSGYFQALLIQIVTSIVDATMPSCTR